MKRAHLIAGLMGVLLAAAARAEEPDELCAELTQFIEAAPRTGSRVVRVMTEWTESPTISCRRENRKAERRLCSYLVGHMSIEFMSANIRRTQRCVGLDVPEEMSYSMSGTDTVRVGTNAKRSITVTLTYETAMKGQVPPFLEIAVSRAN